MGHKVRLGVRPRAATPAPVTAAGVADTFNWAEGGPARQAFINAVLEAGYTEQSGSEWPCEAELEDAGHVLYRDGNYGVFVMPDKTIVSIGIGHGWAHVEIASPSRDTLAGTLAAFQNKYPPLYRQAPEDGQLTVPITFWAYGQFGPSSRLRLIDSAGWEDIDGNYTADVRAELKRLMDPAFVPGKDGQLFLWYGVPGTGKTWALRALASQWRDWAEFHYILDPDRFFGAQPDYMRDVLLAETYSELVADPDGSIDVIESEKTGGKWRVLILEDTGELLSANAKDTQGQGLSRLLNVVDGMVGQGLRVLAIVTTNDQIDEMHPAVVRPGRCASQVEFGPLNAEEASAWLGETVEEGGTLAELYARRGAAEPAFTEEPVEAVAAAAHRIHAQAGHGTSRPVIYEGTPGARFFAAEDESTIAEIQRVAGEHQEEAVGYGETAWNPDTGYVFYVAGDWTDIEPIEADFTAISGVNGFDYEMEAVPEGWWDAQVVYPENPPSWVTEPPDSEAALAEIVALARQPLDE